MLVSHFQKENHARWVWRRGVQSDNLALQVNPDQSPLKIVDKNNPIGAAGTLSLETEDFANRILETATETGTDISVKNEREKNTRTPGNPMGILFGSKFEQQWANPLFWLNLTLFSKDSILKNVGNAETEIREMLQNSAYVSSGVSSALYNSSQASAIKAISLGRESYLEKTDSATFEVIAQMLENSFSEIGIDTALEGELGQNALLSREWIRIVGDVSLLRTKRHKNMLKVIVANVQKAKKEVLANIKRGREHLTRQRKNIESKIQTYQTGMKTSAESSREKNFFNGFVQSVLQNPDAFLAGGLVGMVDMNRIFGDPLPSRVKILDALKSKFEGKILALERSQQLTLNQEQLIQNMDDREQLSNNALNNTNFENVYNALESFNVQTYEGATAQKPENDVLKILTKGLRRLGINARESIFRNAPVNLTTSERLLLLIQFLGNNLDLLGNQKCSLDFKRTLYTWLQDTQAEEAETLAQGTQAEAGTPAQRRYVLNNAIVVRNSAHTAINSLEGIDEALREQNPAAINEKFQTIQTFLTSFKEFFGEDGASGSLAPMIERMPRDEQDLLHAMKDFKGLREYFSETLENLQTQRKTYVDEVLKELAPNPALLEEERARAARVTERMSEMVGGGGLAFARDDYAALEKARSDIFERVKKWDDATQDLANRHFDLPSASAGFAGMMLIGEGLQPSLDAIPEGGEEAAAVAEANNFNGLMRQRMQRTIQTEKESQFNQTVDANMQHQMDTLLARKVDEDGDKVVDHVPEAGTTLDRLEVTDVTNVDRTITFPDSLQHRAVFENLTLIRSGLQEKEEKYVGADLMFHNNTHLVQILEENGKVLAKSWKKPADIHGDRNAILRVAQNEEDATWMILNLSAAGTRAATRTKGERRNIDLAE